MPQLAVTQNIIARFAGRVSTTVPDVQRTGIAAAVCGFGLLLLKSPTDAVGTVRPPANLSVADPNAIILAGASAVGAQIFGAAQFTGVVGPAYIRPCRYVTFLFDAHADWNPTWGMFWGINEAGDLVSEPVSIATSASRQTRFKYRKAVKFEVPAQTGAGGTFQMGYAASTAPVFAADVDAIQTNLASAAAVQLVSGAALNGLIGSLWTFPAKLVTITCDAHADWDATNVTVWGEDQDGNPVEDTVPIATSTTGASTRFFSRVTGYSVPVQTGAGGVATVGYAADAGGAIQWGTLFNHDGVAVYSDTLEEAAPPVGWPLASVVPCLVEGDIDMTAELAVVEGAQVFVRIVAGVGETAGQVRMDDDAGDAVPVEGMFFAETRVAGPVTVHVDKAV